MNCKWSNKDGKKGKNKDRERNTISEQENLNDQGRWCNQNQESKEKYLKEISTKSLLMKLNPYWWRGLYL